MKQNFCVLQTPNGLKLGNRIMKLKRALNTTPSGPTAQFLIYQRYSWRKSANAATNCPTLAGLMAVTGSPLACWYGTCSGWPAITTDIYCTDYDAVIDYSSGERYDTVTLTLGTSRSVGFYNFAWLALAFNYGQGYWSVMNLLYAYVRPDGKINTSPVTTTLPVIYKTVSVQHVHVVQMADADAGDVLVCRWATGGISAGNPATVSAASSNPVQYIDECGSAGVCQTPTQAIPGAVLFGSNCTIVFTLAASETGQYFAVALQIEDFYSSSATTPMSSVPIQFLFYAVAAPGSCSVRPVIIGLRPNRACIGQPINSTVSESVVAQPGCITAGIIRFTTSSPTGLTMSAITHDSTANTYTMILSWVPTAQQTGPQGFCAAAIDTLNQQSDQWCITFVVGVDSPDLNRPVIVQGSASPLGTVFANQSLFSIQASKTVNRPSLNGTNIYFNDAATNSTVIQYDAGWSPNILYSGNTITILVTNYIWTYGHTYYITMDEGFSSGTEFCGPESIKITDPFFWRFNIWDPGLSSTTSTTTAAPTTHTVTSRPVSTSTVNTLLTTTGIQVTTTIMIATTTTTTASTVTTSTTTTTTTSPTTSTPTEISVFTPKDFEDICRNPVAVFNAIGHLAMLLVHIISMFAFYTYLAKTFNPNITAQRVRYEQRLRRLAPG
ncbi:unnamed protein product [Rotaria magnacalcarata]|uniref:Uncharacterized protein n=1 Tax=Rotaria magnacalcarata TaxID=392030 RepID=A0A816P6J7_9BILA|nr:unnamed protein product [Rotaria magnacalcarata]